MPVISCTVSAPLSIWTLWPFALDDGDGKCGSSYGLRKATECDELTDHFGVPWASLELRWELALLGLHYFEKQKTKQHDWTKYRDPHHRWPHFSAVLIRDEPYYQMRIIILNPGGIQNYIYCFSKASWRFVELKVRNADWANENYTPGSWFFLSQSGFERSVFLKGHAQNLATKFTGWNLVLKSIQIIIVKNHTQIIPSKKLHPLLWWENLIRWLVHQCQKPCRHKIGIRIQVYKYQAGGSLVFVYSCSWM